MTDSVLIAGGGIAGLAAAVGLSRVGWQPKVCERAPAFSEVGQGCSWGQMSRAFFVHGVLRPR